MTLQQLPSLPALPQADLSDPALVDFLLARLLDEAGAARGRLADGEPSLTTRRGIALLDELYDALRAGRPIDQMSLDLLVVAHGRHPDFRREWDRWAA